MTIGRTFSIIAWLAMSAVLAGSLQDLPWFRWVGAVVLTALLAFAIGCHVGMAAGRTAAASDRIDKLTEEIKADTARRRREAGES
jgi:hypothetical protein